MASKEVMVTAPLAVVLYDRAFRRSSWKDTLAAPPYRAWFYLALGLTTIPLIAAIGRGTRSETVGFNLGLTWYQYLYTQAWAIAHYLELVIWPRGLTFDYGQNPIHGFRGVPGLMLLAGLGIGTIVAWWRGVWLAFLGTWFFLLLAPSSSVIPIRTEMAAERRVYLALIPVLVLLVGGAETLRQRLTATDETRRRHPMLTELVARSARPLAGIVVAVFFILTVARSRLYANPEALWRDTVAKVPANARAYDNLVAVIVQEDPSRRAEAEELLRRAIAIDSTYVPALTNLSDIVMKEGRFADARVLLERAVRINPDFVNANERLGGVLVKLGDAERAIPYLERVAADAPNDDALTSLALAYMAVGRQDDAANALRRTIALNPRRTDAATYLSAILVEQGRPDEALPYLETAVRSDGGTAASLALLSLVYAHLGRVGEAIDAATASSVRPDGDANAYRLLGRAMGIVQRVTDARRFLRRAIQLEPTNPEAITLLGMVEAAAGNGSDAARLFRRALAVQPGYAPAQQALTKLDLARKR
jgi:tetratricopeptide (TPR) repeat protein